MSQQMGVTGKADGWQCPGERQAGIHPDSSVTVIRSQQERTEEAQGLPQCWVQLFRETQPLS